MVTYVIQGGRERGWLPATVMPFMLHLFRPIGAGNVPTTFTTICFTYSDVRNRQYSSSVRVEGFPPPLPQPLWFISPARKAILPCKTQDGDASG